MDNSVVAPIMHKAKQRFLDKNRDLVAVINGGANTIVSAIAADLALDEDAEIAINNKVLEMTDDDAGAEAGNALTHKDRIVRTTAQGFLEAEFYKQLSLAFLRLRDRGAFTYVTMTPEAAEQEAEIEVIAGQRQSHAAIARQAQAETAAEKLDAEITADWSGRLRTDQIKAKKASNPQYAARLDQMLDEGKLS